jgi:DNA adenine methylase
MDAVAPHLLITLDTGGLRDRAEQRFSATPRPFLKWAGSKQALLPKLVGILPQQFNTYFEPFLGAAALFFCLQPVKAVLNDKCGELIETYEAVRDNPSAVLRHLRAIKRNKTTYYYVRANRSSGRFKKAAEFIYLNKLCWNGLYRVNSDGVFNVPYGASKNTRHLFDTENIHACACALQSKTLMSKDFEFVLNSAKAGDFVFFDPPYVTKHNNNGFRDWNETLFSWKDQERLASTAKLLRKTGVHVVVCNADHEDIIKMYGGFKKKKIIRSSTLASASEFRGSVSEIVLYSSD